MIVGQTLQRDQAAGNPNYIFISSKRWETNLEYLSQLPLDWNLTLYWVARA
jgi:hypothetical protein